MTDLEAHRVAAGWATTPDPDEVDAAVTLVRAATANGAFLNGDETAILDAAIVRYRRLGLTALLDPLMDRVSALCALNPAFAGTLAEHRDRIVTTHNPRPAFLAGTAYYSDGSSLIVFDAGLFHTLWDIAQIVCAAMPVHDGGAPSIPLNQLQAVLALHRAGYRAFSVSAFGTQLVLEPQPARAAALLLDGAQLFVLAHEVAHILLRHEGRPTTSGSASLIISAEANELAADVLAFHIVTEDLRAAGPDAPEPDVLFRLAGARLAFACMEMIEHQSYIFPARTHPAAMRRWAAVHAFAIEGFGPATAARVDALWTPYNDLANTLDEANPPVSSLVDGYQRLTHHRRLLGQPLSAGHLHALLSCARSSELSESTQTQRVGTACAQHGDSDPAGLVCRRSGRAWTGRCRR